jgi:hypothetical protein
MPTLDRITIYPVKSLDGIDLVECGVLACGALENDRRWRLVDLDGRVPGDGGRLSPVSCGEVASPGDIFSLATLSQRPKRRHGSGVGSGFPQ